MRDIFKRCGAACQREIRHVAYAGLAITILFGTDATAQNTLKPENITDPVFLFRAAMSGLLGILIWVARGAEQRIKELEKAEKIQVEQRAKGYARLEIVEKQAALMEHEHRQLLTLVNIQRELMLTDYVKKSELDRHLDKQDLVLDNISRRLDASGITRSERNRRDDKEER